MRLSRNPATFASLWLAAGCNALFGVEEPNPSSGADAGEAGQRGGGPAILPSLPGAGASDEGGAGGTHGGVQAGDAGAGGVWTSPEAPAEGGESGAGGTHTEPPVASGGGPPAPGGAPAEVSAGAGGEEPIGTGAAAGAAGAPGTECLPETRYCVDDTLVSCENGSLVEAPCDFGCESAACRPECTPSSIECRDNRQRVCDSDGRFGQEQACTHQTCVPGEGCDGDCAPNEMRCNADNGDAERCVAAGWQSADVCEKTVERCVLESGVAQCIDNEVFSLPEPTLAGAMWFDRTPDVLYVYPLRREVGSAELLVLQLGAVGAGQPANARIALYEDDGEGYPGLLIGRTGTVTFTGTAEVQGDLVPGIRTLDPERRYWLGIVFAPGGAPQLQCRHDAEAPAGRLLSHRFADTIPEIFPTGAPPDADMECNLFLRVRFATPD